jgi:hypothetical protein
MILVTTNVRLDGDAYIGTLRPGEVTHCWTSFTNKGKYLF